MEKYRHFICIFTVSCLILINFEVSAQKVYTRKLKDTRFTEHYQVLNNNHNVLDGKYELYYKKHLIEKGRYQNGERAGIWNFFNLNSLFEFQYDFTRDILIKQAGEDFFIRRNYTPPLFLGSPLIPYIYILDSLGYPIETYNNNVEGKVVLTLIISTEGKIIECFISESLDESTDKDVLNVVKTFPDDWKWIPAKKDGVKIESAYNITVFFDLD
ncbi:MAG: energy transducer TonB [Marinilabiliaceae bacterium]|nr:energy transducer TonB [Marinilabiliaceae bacterium]